MATVGELARELGVSAPTVRRAIRDLGLEAAGHASRSDGRGALSVDADGASMVADALRQPRKTPSDATGARLTAGEGVAGADAYMAAIEGLKSALSAAEAVRADLTRQLDAKDAQIAELQAQLREANARAARPWWQRVLGRALPPAGRP